MIQQRFFSASIALFITMCTSALIHVASANETTFHKQSYLGFGAGQVKLSPVGIDGSTIRFEQQEEPASHLLMGRDFSPRLSAELHFHDLGRNRLASGEVSYTDLTLSGLYYFSRSHHDRSGFSVYGRFGIGQIKTASDIEIARDHETHLVAGSGIEYAAAKGLAIRAEYWYHDEDASQANLSILYRFNARPDRLTDNGLVVIDGPAPPTIVIPPVPEKVQIPTADVKEAVNSNTPDRPIAASVVLEKPVAPPPMPTAIPTAVPPKDAGIKHARKSAPSFSETTWIETPLAEESKTKISTFKCPNTVEFQQAVDTICSLTPDALRNLTFFVNSANLTTQARHTLNNVATVLIKYPGIKIEVHAHTDNRGNAAKNLALSLKRSTAVAQFLSDRGFLPDQIETRAFGGSQPIASNETPVGRRINRRVELKILP